MEHLFALVTFSFILQLALPIELLTCFNCGSLSDTQTCNATTVCLENQACYARRYSSDGETFVERGCLETTECPVPDVAVVGRRRQAREADCVSCCVSDRCNSQPCVQPDPTLGEWGAWSTWSRCPYTCGQDGIQHRFRNCLSPDAHACDGRKFDTRICHNRVCCNAPPHISFIDHDKTVSPGDFVILYCNATNVDTIRWLIPKLANHTYPSNVNSPAGRPEVVISHVTTVNQGPYVCQATNPCGSTNSTVFISVQ